MAKADAESRRRARFAPISNGSRHARPLPVPRNALIFAPV